LGEWRIQLVNGRPSVFINKISGGNEIFQSQTDVADYQWHHIALSRIGNKFQWFIDGVGEGADSQGFSASWGASDPIYIGCLGGDSSFFVGSIDEFRITRATLYTEDFSPATSLKPGDKSEILLDFDHPDLLLGVQDRSAKYSHGTVLGTDFQLADNSP
jgi:hypothetical protein